MRPCDNLTIDEKEIQNLFISTLDIGPMNFPGGQQSLSIAGCCASSDHIRRGGTVVPEPIDWPTWSSPRRRFFVILGLLAIIIFGGRTALSYNVDALWFGAPGCGDVFRKTLSLHWAVFAAFFEICKLSKLGVGRP
jgi:hypothetical protein